VKQIVPEGVLNRQGHAPLPQHWKQFMNKHQSQNSLNISSDAISDNQSYVDRKQKLNTEALIAKARQWEQHAN